MTGSRFTSVFAPQLEEYVQFKTAMGCYGASRIWYLKRFDAYCVESDCTVFDRDTVEGWVTAQLARTGGYRSWMSYIRDFGRYLAATGHTDAYVLSDRWKAPLVPAHPYLLARGQIDAFFTAAARLQASSPWRWQSAAFFLLMHSCGMRTGELRTLTTGQIDLPGLRIDVIGGKGRRDRALPITAGVADVLAACDVQSRAKFGPGRETFFVSSTGRPVTEATICVIFHRIWRAAGLPEPSGATRPRPYDLRHHFAYANIDRWMKAGTDAAAMLPYLSAYMGHATVESTYYYIHTSPDFMADYADLTAADRVLPKVGF